MDSAGPNGNRGIAKVKHRVLLSGGRFDGQQREIDDADIEIKQPFAGGDPLALIRLGLPAGVEPIGGVVAVAVYFDSGRVTGAKVPMRIFEFLEIEDP